MDEKIVVSVGQFSLWKTFGNVDDLDEIGQRERALVLLEEMSATIKEQIRDIRNQAAKLA